jgi:glycosyltransferase involved in cell wall biosynthesis
LIHSGTSPSPASGPPHGVSVVIPAHNYAHYLPTAIESVLAQTWPEFEILVIDDGSTDDTRTVVAQFTDPRLRYIWQENAGLSAARNTGIREARHTFIAFLDADDAWRPKFLATVVQRFAALGESFGLVASSTSRMDADGRPFDAPKFLFEREGEFTVCDFCLRNRPFSSSVVVRRAVFEHCGGFDTALRSSEDRDVWIRATAAGHRFWLIDEPLAEIRRHGGNMSKNAPRMKENSRAVLFKAWRANAVSRWNVFFWLRVFSVYFFQIAWTHFDGGYRFHAFGYLMTSVLLWPIHVQPKRFFEPHLFRARAFLNFCRRTLTGA